MGGAMADFPFDIVGFDLDGTLFDTSSDLADAVNHVLGHIGRAPLSLPEILPMIGQGTRHMLGQALQASGGADDLDRLVPELIAYYQDNIARGTKAYPGLIEAMDALEAKGVKLTIVTNKLEHLTTRLVAALGLDHRFAVVIGGDTMGRGGAKPSPAGIEEMIRRAGGGRAAFVGDSVFDIAAARNAGIPSVAVAFGFGVGDVAALGADAVIERYDQLVPTLERLGVRSGALPAS